MTKTTGTLERYTFAAAELGESMQSPDTCDCCGREGLKRTVKLLSPAGRSVWFGLGCAARAMGVGVDVVRQARRDAEAAAMANERAAEQAVWRAEDAQWQRFLDSVAPGLDRFRQIHEVLGGMASARAAYRAWLAGGAA